MRKLAVVLMLGLCASAFGQMVTGYGSAWYGPFAPPFYAKGSYMGTNVSGEGETDFYTVDGLGGFSWWELGQGAALPSTPSMTLNGTTLAVAQLDGNAATATALQNTPSQCVGGEYATGISANGGANCAGTSTLFDGYYSQAGCALTNSGNLGSCTGTFTFSPAQPDVNYMAFCVADSTTAMTVAVNTEFSAGKTTDSFAYSETELMQNSGSPMTPTLYCHIHHN